jgi:hypothetical protein
MVAWIDGLKKEVHGQQHHVADHQR